MNDLWKCLRREEQIWRQKSRVNWLKEGDKNTKFFHSMTDGRKRTNYISDIFFDGERFSEPHLVKNGVVNFFTKHYENMSWNSPTISGLNLKRLLESERIALEEDFSLEEVWMTLSSCDGNKVSGPNGLNLRFVKENWDVIRDVFMEFTKEFHKDGSIARELNRSFIALIPKIDNPMTMKDFRPISLIGSMYKVIAKVLANRIKKVMDSVIWEFQMAFVANRQIIDSFVVAEEIISRWKGDKEGGLLIKLDFEKAYDSVDFGFLDYMMEGMGFSVRWRGWIKECISSPLISVLVNGSSTSQFGIERGLRQGWEFGDQWKWFYGRQYSNAKKLISPSLILAFRWGPIRVRKVLGYDDGKN
ncbi:hypothetical protein Dsin_020970 [Dipteronia sinensis]|uniref:Reverse transcriptase domain-containing protein n=1 Tax=Dipteronia sinensis TaxID=43782 RepID=A0AAE0E5G5_9ROSI|nr:hypothetical protein Dsin_020970 [Dipteronia sinensis]